MLGTLLRRITVLSLDGVVRRGQRSQRKPVRAVTTVLDRARVMVGLDRVLREAPLPQWSGAHPDRPMWPSDQAKLEKWQVTQGIRIGDDATEAVTTATVEVYFRRGCPFSHSAMALLREREVQFASHDVTGDAERLAWLREITGQPTTPQMFVDGQSIGGFTELERLDAQGGLVRPAKTRSKVSLPVLHPEASPFEVTVDETIAAYESSEERFEGDALVDKVRLVLDECRPMVQADGGDIELLDVLGDVVHVQLTGNCIGCPSSQATLRHGIERRLKARIPQISGIASPQL